MKQRVGLWITLGVSMVYLVYLGASWLPLGYSDKELSAFVSRVWDIKRELAEHHQLPWWTPYYMSGSSYGLNHSQGFYLVPWLLFSTVFSLQAAGKLMALASMLASAIAMYYCARHFLRNEWAAALAAIVYLIHPEQIIRAATTEHMGVIVFFPFIPLTWLFFDRSLQTGRFRDLFWCAAGVAGLMWTHNKQAFVQFVFLFLYLVYWLWSQKRSDRWKAAARSCAMIGALSLALGAFFIVPGYNEAKLVKLFYGDPLEGWQRNYAFKSMLGLVDRDAAVTKSTIQEVNHQLQLQRYRPHTQQDAALLTTRITRVFGMGSDAPEKYAGIALLLVIAATALFNRQRINRGLFWFFVAMLMLGVMLATGLTNVWRANWATLTTLLGLDGVPQSTRLTVFVSLAATAAFLVLFYRRKLTSRNKKFIAGGALAFFLFVPAFKVLALVPFFREIRAPFVFYDLPSSFFTALLAGFFVTDVLAGERWRAHASKIVWIVVVLLLIDFWPYQKSMKDNGVPARTLKNLEVAYTALRQDTDWVKTYSVSGRYFHLLGPMYGGKPQVYEAFYNWMAPLGTGILNQNSLGSLDNHRAFLNLMNARYVVFDKTDPNNAQPQIQQLLIAYRQLFAVTLENEDFVVFRNETVRPYISAFARPCLFLGDFRDSARVTLALSERNFPLVQGDGATTAEGSARYEKVYVTDTDLVKNVDVGGRTVLVAAGAPLLLPSGDGQRVVLENIKMTRERSGRIVMSFRAPADCTLVIAESYYPYWRAEVNGQPARVFRVNTGLMGCDLLAGEHTLTLSYELPKAYAAAAIISLLALAIFVGLVVWDGRRPQA